MPQILLKVVGIIVDFQAHFEHLACLFLLAAITAAATAAVSAAVHVTSEKLYSIYKTLRHNYDVGILIFRANHHDPTAFPIF